MPIFGESLFTEIMMRMHSIFNNLNLKSLADSNILHVYIGTVHMIIYMPMANANTFGLEEFSMVCRACGYF